MAIKAHLDPRSASDSDSPSDSQRTATRRALRLDTSGFVAGTGLQTDDANVTIHNISSAGLLIETEVWPNLLQACRRQGIPVALVNARMNEKSARRARCLAPLARQAYGALSMVLAQSEPDAQRLRSLGAQVDAVLGNLKFDAEPDAEQLALGRAWGLRSQRPLLGTRMPVSIWIVVDFPAPFGPI